MNKRIKENLQSKTLENATSSNNPWILIIATYVLSLFAIPTLTGFFVAIFVIPKLTYLPVGVITLVVLVANYVMLRRIKIIHESLSQGMRDAIKLNLLLGILAWAIYFMPVYGPIVGNLFK